MEQLEKSIEIAKAQAGVLGEALKASNISIVGGQDSFFENFTKSITVGKMVEGFIDTSPTAKKMLDQVMGKVTRSDEAKPSTPEEAKADEVEEAVTDLTPGE
jgi:phosphoribosylformylglycinamidine (FGAM) synthase-like enzyme